MHNYALTCLKGALHFYFGFITLDHAVIISNTLSVSVDCYIGTEITESTFYKKYKFPSEIFDGLFMWTLTVKRNLSLTFWLMEYGPQFCDLGGGR